MRTAAKSFANSFRPNQGRQAVVRPAATMIACSTTLHLSPSTSLWLGGYEDQRQPGKGSA